VNTRRRGGQGVGPFGAKASTEPAPEKKKKKMGYVQVDKGGEKIPQKNSKTSVKRTNFGPGVLEEGKKRRNPEPFRGEKNLKKGSVQKGRKKNTINVGIEGGKAITNIRQCKKDGKRTEQYLLLVKSDRITGRKRGVKTNGSPSGQRKWIICDAPCNAPRGKTHESKKVA